MNVSLTPELLERQLTRRFSSSNKNSGQFTINKDLYIDLLCVFNDPNKFKASDFLDYPLPSILLYLKKTHELYKSKNLQEIVMAVEKLDEQDGVISALRFSLSSFFAKFKKDLEGHIQEEEVKLFPYVESLLISENSHRSSLPIQRTILGDFLNQHDDHLERDLFNLVKALENLSDKYSDSFAFRMLLNKVSIFELDLRVHAKIEEEVLVPKAIALEKKVFGKNVILSD